MVVQGVVPDDLGEVRREILDEIALEEIERHDQAVRVGARGTVPECVPALDEIVDTDDLHLEQELVGHEALYLVGPAQEEIVLDQGFLGYDHLVFAVRVPLRFEHPARFQRDVLLDPFERGDLETRTRLLPRLFIAQVETPDVVEDADDRICVYRETEARDEVRGYLLVDELVEIPSARIALGIVEVVLCADISRVTVAVNLVLLEVFDEHPLHDTARIHGYAADERHREEGSQGQTENHPAVVDHLLDYHS